SRGSSPRAGGSGQWWLRPRLANASATRRRSSVSSSLHAWVSWIAWATSMDLKATCWPGLTWPRVSREVEDTTASTGYPAVTPRPRCSTSSSSPGGTSRAPIGTPRESFSSREVRTGLGPPERLRPTWLLSSVTAYGSSDLLERDRLAGADAHRLPRGGDRIAHPQFAVGSCDGDEGVGRDRELGVEDRHLEQRIILGVPRQDVRRTG